LYFDFKFLIRPVLALPFAFPPPLQGGPGGVKNSGNAANRLCCPK
jgi:hypothetical protein